MLGLAVRLPSPALAPVCTYSTPRLVGQDSMGLLIQIKPGPLTSFLLFL